MKIIGMHSTAREGEIYTTLHLETDFDAFYSNPEMGRTCVGKRVESVYVGAYDCSGLKVGMDVDILYDKAITTARGTFQPVKKIEILASK